MASRTLIATTALLLCLNLLFSTLVSSTYCPPTPSTPSVPKVHKSPPSKNPYPNPNPKPSPSPSKGSCPRDTLKLAACANVLNGLVNLVVGTPPVTPCCELISGIADLEAALCLCTAIKANVLGINLNVSVALSLVLNNCGKKVPDGFQCAKSWARADLKKTGALSDKVAILAAGLAKIAEIEACPSRIHGMLIRKPAGCYIPLKKSRM